MKHYRRRGRTRPLRGPDRMWCSEKILMQYWRRAKKRVGEAKASLGKTAVLFNPSLRAPAWVKRHFSTVSGSGKLLEIKGASHAKFRASEDGLVHLRQRTINFVIKGRIIKMQKEMEKILRHSAKKAGFKVR